MTTKEVIQLSSRRILLRIRFWYKLISMNQNRLVYQVYKQRREELIKDIKNNKKIDNKNWCYWTWQFLKDLHLEHVWESEKAGNTYNNLVRKLIKIKEESEWRERMEKKSKLKLYRKLKSRLVIEDYVVELEREQRRLFRMLRGGTNKLGIERKMARKTRGRELVSSMFVPRDRR